MHPNHDCVSCARRVPWITFFGNFFITLYKVAVGILGNSPALIADGLHSFTDVIGTGVILVSTRVSGRAPNQTYQYGYGKAEYLSAVFIYVVLMFMAGFIFYQGGKLLLSGVEHVPGIFTFFGAVVSILYSMLMYRLGYCAGRQTNSPALLANAFENRADAIASMAVCAGILGAILIHPALDPLAAMFVGVCILSNCIHELRKAISSLMDRGLPTPILQRIREVVGSEEGVSRIQYIKSRDTGQGIWLDLGIEVSEEMAVMQARGVAERVRRALLGRSQRFHTVEVYVMPAREG